MTTKIFLVRHAEAEGNLYRIAHGQYDSTITPQGYRQLHYLRQRFAGERLDSVYGSDLTRTHTTASALYTPRQLPFRPMPLLREIRLGAWEQKSWAEVVRMGMESYLNFNSRPDLWQVEGAESFTQVRSRMLTGIRQIAAENPGGTVAAASHGAALRTLLGTVQGLSLEEIGATGHGDNTAVSLLEVDGDQIRLIFRDDISHLPPETSTFRKQAWFKDDVATDPGLWYRDNRSDAEGRDITGIFGEEPAGRVAFHREGDALRIGEYQILPALRGQRLGVQLLGQAVQFARELGLERVVLTAPADYAAYFAKLGFVETARGERGVDMALDIRRIIRDIP